MVTFGMKASAGRLLAPHRRSYPREPGGRRPEPEECRGLSGDPWARPRPDLCVDCVDHGQGATIRGPPRSGGRCIGGAEPEVVVAVRRVVPAAVRGSGSWV